MRAYYDNDGIVIYHGDCRDVLPLLDPVDLVLTDPPYGFDEARANNQSRGKIGAPPDYGTHDWDDRPPDRELLEAVIAAGRHAIVFGGNYFALPPSRGWIVWDKDNGRTDFADCELAWTNLPQATRKIVYRWQGMHQQYRGVHKDDRVHPTQKPLRVMRWCIELPKSEVETILDPFMGSGTTLRAAKDLGRRAIGIEIEQRYCELAVKRLRQGVLFT